MEEPKAKRLKTSNETESEVFSYGQVLEKVGKCLTKESVGDLTTIAELDPSEKDKVTSSEGNGSHILFSILEEKMIISKSDIGWLQRNLRQIGNEKARKIIDDFTNETGEEFELPSEPEYSEGEGEDDETDTFENFLEKVGLKDKYPGKLKLKTFLQLGKNDQNNYAHTFWQRLTTLNYRAGILQEIVSQDYSMRDFIFCVLQCGDDFLRQDILEKMSACQLAVPVVLQGVGNSKPLFLLWALRRIMKKWRGQSDAIAIEHPIISYPVLTISVLRIGNVRISKSQLMNTMLSYTQGYPPHTFFLNREKDFAVPRFSPGSVECVWFLPMRESEKQIFKEVIAFFNLRGDCIKYPQQTAFVCKAAHLTIALITTSKHKIHKKHVSFIKKNSKSTLFISVSEEESGGATSKKAHRPKYKDGCFFVNVVQKDILSKMVCEEIVKIETTVKTPLESLTDICGDKIQIDEKEELCRDARNAVREIFYEGKDREKLDVLHFKQCNFPLQLVWKDWVEIDKASLQIDSEGSESFEHQMEKKMLMKKEKRNLQLQTKLTPTMKAYLEAIKNAKYNSVSLQYIFSFIEEKIYHMVHESTKRDISAIAELERDIRKMRNHKMTESNSNNNGSKSHEHEKSKVRKDHTYKLKVNACNQLYANCRAQNLGGEHFLRELGQLFEAYMELPGGQASQVEESAIVDLTLLPSLAAQLVKEMQSLEIMDGDTGCVPLTWVTSVLDTLTRELNDPKILVLSVIGVQSSGKSTLLNSMFGVRFPVRAGRCTRGLFIQLLKLSDGLFEELGFHYLVIVDSEGIRSIDHDDRRFDNELVTLALSIANVTIFNIEGENIGPDMIGILQIAAHALMRMKEVDLECQCRIVQQRVSDMTASDRNKANTKKIKETLDAATKFAAEEEGLKYEEFAEVVDLQIDEDLQYVPCLWAGGMAPPNHLYSETVSKIKDKLFRDFKGGNISSDLTLSAFTERVRDVWKAIKEENFVFNFYDSVKAVDYNRLCLVYNQLIAQMRQDVQAKISSVSISIVVNPDGQSLKPDIKTLKNIIETEIEEQRKKVSESVKQHILNHPRKNTLIRYEQEFVHDVNVVIDETKSHSLATITDEYEIKRINLDLPQFRKASLQILTVEAKEEASRLIKTGFVEGNPFNKVWQNLMGTLKTKNNLSRPSVTPSSLPNFCEKLLLKITRDMAVGSEVKALLSSEGGMTKHSSLEDCSKYISDKYVKSWLRHETLSYTEKKQTTWGENRKQLKEEERDSVEMLPQVKGVRAALLPSHPAVSSESKVAWRGSTPKTIKREKCPNEELMHQKRQQAITYLKRIVEDKLILLQKERKVFDANVFQLMLRKILKELSTQHGAFNVKLPYRLIAKGLLCFCARYVEKFSKGNDSDIEDCLDFNRFTVQTSFLSFLHQGNQNDAAAEFVVYYIEKIFLHKVETFSQEINSKVDYSQYVDPVHIPWDLLHFVNSSYQFRRMYYDILDCSLRDIVNMYVEDFEEEYAGEIYGDMLCRTGDYINDFINQIGDVELQVTSWKEWCNILGSTLGCPFIKSAGEIFQITDVSRVSKMIQTELALQFREYDHEDFNFDQNSFINAAGLSYVCDEICPMCGAWCDNILKSHTVHSSSLHRPRGLMGETYPVKGSDRKGLSADSESAFASANSSSELSDERLREYVLEDCFTSVVSETATFEYEGKMHLCKNFKNVCENWDIKHAKGKEAYRLFWQRYFATYMEYESNNIPNSWYDITEEDVVQSLKQAKAEELHEKKKMSSMPLKKRVLASCSKDS